MHEAMIDRESPRINASRCSYSLVNELNSLMMHAQILSRDVNASWRGIARDVVIDGEDEDTPLEVSGTSHEAR